jgi:hypothetical protein
VEVEALVVVLAILMLLVVLAALFADWLDGRRPDEQLDWLDRVTGEQVIVHLVDDQTVKGALVDVHRDGLVLRAAQLIAQPAVDIAGDVFVPRDKVLMLQRLVSVA